MYNQPVPTVPTVGICSQCWISICLQHVACLRNSTAFTEDVSFAPKWEVWGLVTLLPASACNSHMHAVSHARHQRRMRMTCTGALATVCLPAGPYDPRQYLGGLSAVPDSWKVDLPDQRVKAAVPWQQVMDHIHRHGKAHRHCRLGVVCSKMLSGSGLCKLDFAVVLTWGSARASSWEPSVVGHCLHGYTLRRGVVGLRTKAVC